MKIEKSLPGNPFDFDALTLSRGDLEKTKTWLENHAIEIDALVTASRQLHAIPSASALEICDKRLFVAGDDSSEVVELDFSYNLIKRVKLFESPVEGSERIPKKLKQDLECSLSINLGPNQGVLFLGSGSNERRENGYFVPTVKTGDYPVRSIELAPLYDHLRTFPEFTHIKKLNFEAAVSTNSHVVLMHRKTGPGQNLAVYIERTEFENYLLNSGTIPSSICIGRLQMPSLDGVAAGISGATLLPDIPLILASASFEATEDAIEDGKILGSALFLLPAHPQLLDLKSHIKPLGFADIMKDGIRLPYKVESVAIKSGSLSEGYQVVAVSDDDKGGSEVLELLLKITSVD